LQWSDVRDIFQHHVVMRLHIEAAKTLPLLKATTIVDYFTSATFCPMLTWAPSNSPTNNDHAV
jgi:hypothetical protein